MTGPAIDAGLLDRARTWLGNDPDPIDRDELSALITRAEAGDPDAAADLEDRFQGPLRFGTAGLRGLIGAGESRMNRAVVIRATAGLVRYLLERVPNAAERGIVIGRDGRHRSLELQEEAAAVAAAAGLRVHFLPGTAPTPLVAFATKHLGAAAGVAVTASHNPPAYNGYKVYFDNAAQIIPPHDAGIAKAIDATPPPKDVPRTPLAEARASGRVADAGAGVEDAYLAALATLRQVPNVPAGELKIAYTALHGVGERLARAALSAGGFTRIDSVPEQAEPDPRFPTVKFPNPEEPEALARVLALAQARGSDLVIANDPDADRLAVAVRDGDGRHVVLTGNEIGVLLAHHVLTTDPHPTADRLVITTIVSSAQLKRMAADLGVRYEETLTGFKWIANQAIELERRDRSRFVFGYEEALGYTVGGVTRDKDGIGAALVFAELAAGCLGRGETVLDRLSAIRRRHGLYVSRQKSVTLPGAEGAAQIARVMRGLRECPPTTLGDVGVSAVWDLETQKRIRADGSVEWVEGAPPADVIIYELAGGGRAAVRPSGTEPKIKLYLEVAEMLASDETIAAGTSRGNARLDALSLSLLRTAGL